MKNYFIANGEVLNTNMSIEEMELRVQAILDESTSGMAQFKIKEISEKEIRMFFVRDFDYNPNQPIIFDAGMFYVFPLILPITKGNVVKTFIIGFVVLAIGLYFVTQRSGGIL